MNPRSSIFFLALVAFSCTKDTGHAPVGGYPPEVSAIVQRNCAVSGCHNAASSAVAGGINLETWEDLFRGSNSGSPVIPYSTRFSSLLYFVNTYPDLGLVNEPTMPLNRSPLSREEVITLKKWISRGAPDLNGRVKWSDDPNRKKLYVVNQGCDVVSVLDAETGLPIRMVEVGLSTAQDAPHSVRVSPDGKYWYVIFINSNFMQKYRCSDDLFVGDIPLTPYAAGMGGPESDARDWNAMTISADGCRAYCVSWTQNGKISVVDLEKMTFVRWIGGQHYPHGIALHPTGDRIYVTAQTGNFVTELDTGLTMANEIPLEPVINYNPSLDVHDIVFSPDGKKLAVTCQGTSEVRVLDLATRQVQVVSTGTLPQEIIYDDITDRYFVTCTGDTATRGIVTAIDRATLAATHLTCGYQPHGITVNKVTSELYVVSRNVSEGGIPPHHGSVCFGRNGFVSFVDLETFTVKPGAFELSVDPYFITARP